jgi:hypothetical protein
MPVTDPERKIENWLHADVEPLAPQPGTFDRIGRRARRRKSGRALMSAAGAVIVIAAAVALPRTAETLLHVGSNPAPGQAAAGPARSARLSARGRQHTKTGGGHTASQSATPAPAGTSSLSPGGSGQPVPANFQPTSVTFIGQEMGAVIGQAGTPGRCATQYCTSLAGTSNYGATWYGVSAPVTGAPRGATGVSQIRFLNSDGWAFGPEVWVSHDSGGHWREEKTFGLRVTDLETAGNRAFALFASCAGEGSAYAANCDSFSLYSSAASDDQWLPVPGPAQNLALTGTVGGQPASANLLLAGGSAAAGYLLAPSGQIYSGPLTGAAWAPVGPAPCAPGKPGPAGQPAGGLLAAGSGHLLEVCTSATSVAGSQIKIVYASSDGGKTWRNAGQVPAAGLATSLAAAQGNLIVLATTAGLDVSADGGASWTPAETGPPGPAAGLGGFSYVGMTSQLRGVAVPADPRLHEVYTTTDGGASWQPSQVSTP